MKKYIFATSILIFFSAGISAAPDFKPCTWGWILENCPAKECDAAKDCRQHVIDTWLERAKNGECSAGDAHKIKLSCEGCNRTFCK